MLLDPEVLLVPEVSLDLLIDDVVLEVVVPAPPVLVEGESVLLLWVEVEVPVGAEEVFLEAGEALEVEDLLKSDLAVLVVVLLGEEEVAFELLPPKEDLFDWAVEELELALFPKDDPVRYNTKEQWEGSIKIASSEVSLKKLTSSSSWRPIVVSYRVMIIFSSRQKKE